MKPGDVNWDTIHMKNTISYHMHVKAIRKWFYHNGNRNRTWSDNTVMCSTKKRVGIFADFSVLLREFVSMRQLHNPSFFRLFLSSFCNVGLLDRDETKSMGVYSLLFLIVREAPFIKMARTGLPEANFIELLTARCNGVFPEISY